MDDSPKQNFRRYGVATAHPDIPADLDPMDYNQSVPNVLDEGPKKVISNYRYVLIGSFCFICGIIVGHLSGIFLTLFTSDNWANNTKSVINNDCHSVSAIIENPWERETLFSPLSPTEMNTVLSHMLKERIVDKYNGEVSSAYIQVNYITRMFLHPASKTDALRYLDNDGPFPGRHAEVHVVRGNRTQRKIHVQEYKVGPVGTPDKMTIENLGPPIDFDRRQFDHREYEVVRKLVDKSFKKMNALFRISFDGAEYLKDILTVIQPITTSRVFDRQSNCFLVLNTKLFTSDPLPVSAKIFHGGNDFSSWYVFDFYYNNQGPFPTAETLMDEYDGGNLDLIEFPRGHVEKMKKNRTLKPQQTDSQRPLSNLVPPRSYEPEGPRYLIKGHEVKWMGWSFEISVNQIRGPSLFNVKFKGERIAYEISLNDISLLYSSSTTGAGFSNAMFIDTVYNLGEHFTIYKGVDCPEHSSVIPTTYFEDAGAYAETVDAFCVFEADGQEMLWRHQGNGESGGMRDHFLVIRAPLTLGNYDYTTEFHFKLDGKLHTLITSSGLLLTAYWDKDDPFIAKDTSRTPFGYRVASKTLGAIHDHTFAFKVDLDIVDRKNRFEVIHLKAGNISEIYKSHNVDFNEKMQRRFPFTTSRYLDYELIQNETALKINSDEPAFWTVVSNNHKNSLGTKRGFRILPKSLEWNEVLPVSHPVMTGLSHMKSSCAVTKQKDSERYISFSQYDATTLNRPLKTLDHYLNSESIVDEDVVTWLSLRFLHIPTAEDFPVTTRIQRGFSLIPFNFFDKTATFDMPQMYEYNRTLYSPYSVPKCYENFRLHRTSSIDQELTYATGYND